MIFSTLLFSVSVGKAPSPPQDLTPSGSTPEASWGFTFCRPSFYTRYGISEDAIYQIHRVVVNGGFIFIFWGEGVIWMSGPGGIEPRLLEGINAIVVLIVFVESSKLRPM